MVTFNKNYFKLAISLFVIEVFIAIFIRDKFIRPYLGDVLVVMLLFYSLKSFLKAGLLPIAMVVMGFACTIEILQYVRIIYLLELEHSFFARILLGTSFEWSDLLAYATGISIVVLIDKNYFSKEAAEA